MGNIPILPGTYNSRTLPVVIVLDISGSMASKKDKLNQVFEEVIQELKESNTTRGIVDLCILKFNTDVFDDVDFEKIDNYNFVPLEQSEFGGLTSLGRALLCAKEKTNEYKDKKIAQYEIDGSSLYFEPLFIVLTDGMPYLGQDCVEQANRDFENACKVFKEIESPKDGMSAKGTLIIFPIGEGKEVDVNTLKKLTNHPNRVVPLDEKFEVDRLVHLILGTINSSTVTAAERDEKLDQFFVKKLDNTY